MILPTSAASAELKQMAIQIWAPPPDIRQEHRDICWAAVLEVFCSITPARPRMKQGEIVREFIDLCNSELDWKMPLDGLRRLFVDPRFGLQIEEVSNVYFTKTPNFLLQKLRSGYVILGYWEPRTHGWHVGLIYGLDGCRVHYLNPDNVDGGLLANELEYFGERGNLIVASQRW
jgi:hypothetical protein